MTESAQSPAGYANLATLITRMAGTIGSQHYPTGDRAMLRRWAPGQPIPLAFYRLWLCRLENELPPEAQTAGWMALAWGLAQMGVGSHIPKRPWGRALAEAGFSEHRLERLLAAPEDVRIDLFMDAIRILASRHESFDWVEAARFLLTTDPDKREGVQRRLAQAFYRYQPQKAKE